MPLPKPKLGLVVHYGFVWAGAGRRSPPDAGNDRPCVIVCCWQTENPQLTDGMIPRVAYLPISHVAPKPEEEALAIPPGVARHLGLSWERSFVYTTYAVEDDWPFDVTHVPGSDDRFDYGFVPERFFSALSLAFAEHLSRRPGFVHRR